MDPSIANDLGFFLAEILSEHLDQIVADIFRASMLVALIKPSTVVDIRPIGAADGMQKLLGACCYEGDKPTLPAWQLGVGTPNAAIKIQEEARRARWNDELALAEVEFNVDRAEPLNNDG